jgi:glycine oxidase
MNLPTNQDVLIIGGGVIGLSIARKLHQKSLPKITIVERGNLGQESSFAAAGMLAAQAEIDKIDDFFHFCIESNLLYSPFAKELIDETGIDIELDKNGTLFLALTEDDEAEIRRRFQWQQKAGLRIEYLSAAEVRKVEPFISPDARAALFFPDDRQVENRRLLAALQKYAAINNINIIEGAEIKNLLVENKKVIGAETSDVKFFAKKTVLATGAWTSHIKIGENALPPLLRGVKPIRGQMVCFKTAKRLFSKVIYSPRGYIVPRQDGRILAGATVEDVGFDKSVTAGGIDFVRENALEIAPSLMNLEVSEKWSGLRPYAPDGLPILGEFPQMENLFIATAHYRNGILLAPLTAEILACKIAENKDSKYLEIFSPRRFQK